MNSSTTISSFSSKEKDFVKWFLDKQKQVCKILLIILFPFVVGALLVIFHILKDKLKWLNTMDYVILIGGLTVITLLVFDFLKVREDSQLVAKVHIQIWS